ncbi:MAG: Nre family DNA repair protein [Candidatus Aenigmatarchaeota archaeon]
MNLCVRCKGTRILCGKSSCPLLIKFYSYMRTKPLIDSTTLNGSSPPACFVGSYGYPKVFVGPLVPPKHGDTSFMDTPEMWRGKTMWDIVDFRFQLVRGKFVTDVKNFEGKIIERTREIALAQESPSAEVEFKNKPRGLSFNSETQPFGPSANVIGLNIENKGYNKKIEKAFYDTDLKAVPAVVDLYKNGVLISKIQKAFSVGAFGIGKSRRFVPTRWSITAVDDMISKHLIEQVKTFPLINEYLVYEHAALDNRWFVLMIPHEWSYEQMEAWYPKTLWNPSDAIDISTAWEGFNGLKGYPDTAGCYFSTRLAATEYLANERRQAAVIVFREIHPGYTVPVGVWHTRESIRDAVKKTPVRFSSMSGALDYLSKKMTIPVKRWVEKSSLLRNLMRQRKLSDFIKPF